MKPIKNLILALTISLQAFSVITMAQSVEEKGLIIAANITGEVQFGRGSQLLEGTIELRGNVAIQEGDCFILGFEKVNGESANEIVIFDKLPELKIVHKGKTLIENEDFTMVLQEGKIEIYFNIEIKGQLEMRIDSLQVTGKREIAERAYYMVLEEHLSGIDKKIEIQQVNINYRGLSNFGGRVTFVAGSHNCERDRKEYGMKAMAYVDDITGQMMVPLKDALKVLGAKEKSMKYSKGIFEAYAPGKYTFTVNSKTVLDGGGNRKIEISQPIIINECNMYIALEDLATALNADIERNSGSNESQTLYLPMHIWIED